MRRRVGRFFAGLLLVCVAAQAETLIPTGALWRYHDGGKDLGTAWQSQAYSDASWKVGLAQLGYGDGDEATILSYGPDPNQKYPCYYFRHTFDVVNPAVYETLSLRVLRDDGCVVYLNGFEVARYGMPSGTIAYSTPASAATEYGWDPVRGVPNYLVAGANVLAVEVHQGNATSSDLSLDLELTAEPARPQIQLVGPGEGAVVAGSTAALRVRVDTANAAEAVDVAFYSHVPNAAPEFTIVALPDTQNYVSSGSLAGIFTKQTQWIVGNRSARNIVFVTHEGDMANQYDDATQWARVNTSMSLLDGWVAYGVQAGNHDQPTTLFNSYFPYTRFTGQAWYGGHYPAGQNDNNYELISAGGVEFLLLHLSFWPPSDVLAWANSVLQAYPDRKAIITTHGFLGLDGSRNVHVIGSTEFIWNALVIPNDNVYFILCGHVAGEAARTDVVKGRQVHQVLADYQGLAEGGQGWLRLMRFVPAENRVYVQTYSPHLNQYQTDADSQFSLYFPMDHETLLGTDTGVPSGAEASVDWADLTPGNSYSWRVRVTETSSRVTESPVWQFTAAASENQPPVAEAQTLTTAEDNALNLTLTATDVENDPLIFSVTIPPQHGSLSGTAPNLTYTPTPNYVGPDSFQFVANDGQANSAPAPVTIAVGPINDPPVALAQSVTTMGGTPVDITLTAEDVDGDELSYSVAAPPAHGSLSGEAPSLTYTPAAGYQGSDSFQFEVNDGQVSSAPAAVNITITAVNHPPVADAQSLSTLEDLPVLIMLAGDDPDSDPLTYLIKVPPSHGSLSGTPPGLTYTPSLNYCGQDFFTFAVSDGRLESATANVNLTIEAVNDAPTAGAGSDQSVAAGDPVQLDGSGSQDPDGDALIYVWTQVGGDSVALTGTDPARPTFTAPMVETTTALNFELVVSDGQVASAVDSVTVTVAPLDVNAYVVANPALTYGVLGGAGFQATYTAGDGFVQTITESASGNAGRSALDVQYTLATSAARERITDLELHLTGSWTRLDTADDLRAYVWDGLLWQEITSDLLADGLFNPMTPGNYVDAAGQIQVRFTDSVQSRNEKKDTLTVDRLYARITVGLPDAEPPARPSGLSGAASGWQVNLAWTPNAESDLAGYHLYRAAESAGSYTRLNGQLLPAPGYSDSVPAAGTYYYVVTAVDRAGNESLPSEELEVTTTVLAPGVHVAAITMSLEKAARTYQAVAGVEVRDQYGQTATGAMVLGDWYFKGALVVSGVSAATGLDGTAVLGSGFYSAKSGNVFTFRVTNLSLSGYAYDPGANVVTDNSIAVP